MYALSTLLVIRIIGSPREKWNGKPLQTCSKEYLIRVADKYKIPQTEREETRALLESYKSKMENLKKAGEWID